MKKTACNPIDCLAATPLRVLLFALCASVVTLGVAYTAQYGFNMQPCELCYWQRVPYFTVIGLSLLGLILKSHKHLTTLLAALCAIAFFVGAAIAGFHVGVEYKWWEGTDSCGAKGAVGQSIEELRAYIMNAPLARCDEPVGVVMGISMAGWNALWSLTLGVLVSALTCKAKMENKKRGNKQ